MGISVIIEEFVAVRYAIITRQGTCEAIRGPQGPGRKQGCSTPDDHVYAALGSGTLRANAITVSRSTQKPWSRLIDHEALFQSTVYGNLCGRRTLLLTAQPVLRTVWMARSLALAYEPTSSDIS